ncbi:MAG: acyltransferase [Vicinamibacterales bacterium]
MSAPRLVSLDWQRGLLALSIMVYHLTSWKLYPPQSDEVLGRLGIYGVSMFFLLSGLSMAVVYRDFFVDARSPLRFFVRRIFRIWPLMWFAVGAVTVGGVLFKAQAPDWGLILLNVTTLFGFVSPGSYINTGAWSIGNEMVYYALTPPLLVLYGRRVLYGNLVVATTIAVGAYFAFAAMSTERTLAVQWQTYINPFNNLFFYCTGVAIYYNARGLVLRPKDAVALLVVAVALFCAYPADGDLVTIVTGVNRLVFFLASALAVLAFYKLTLPLPAAVSAPLTALGLATYGVYLLHPIVYQFVELATRALGHLRQAPVVMAATMILTVLLSLLVYSRLEAPLIRLGKLLTTPTRPSLAAEAALDAAPPNR